MRDHKLSKKNHWIVILMGLLGVLAKGGLSSLEPPLQGNTYLIYNHKWRKKGVSPETMTIHCQYGAAFLLLEGHFPGGVYYEGKGGLRNAKGVAGC